MYCGKCGKQINDNSKFCSYCGYENCILKNVSNEKNTNPIIANKRTDRIYVIE